MFVYINPMERMGGGGGGMLFEMESEWVAQIYAMIA